MRKYKGFIIDGCRHSGYNAIKVEDGIKTTLFADTLEMIKCKISSNIETGYIGNGTLTSIF